MDLSGECMVHTNQEILNWSKISKLETEWGSADAEKATVCFFFSLQYKISFEIAHISIFDHLKLKCDPSEYIIPSDKITLVFFFLFFFF